MPLGERGKDAPGAISDVASDRLRSGALERRGGLRHGAVLGLSFRQVVAIRYRMRGPDRTRLVIDDDLGKAVGSGDVDRELSRPFLGLVLAGDRPALARARLKSPLQGNTRFQEGPSEGGRIDLVLIRRP